MELETNVIYCGDCLIKLKEIPDESVDLIYIDPPFSSNRNYVAFWQEQEKRHFEDRFENVTAYLDYMRPRVRELYRVLKQTGSFLYHCDWHASHYVKVLLDTDELFGYKNFQNEIVWYYRGGGLSKKRFARRHDVILFYTKSNNWYFDPDPARQEYAEATKERFSHYIGNVRQGRDYGIQKLNPKGKHPDDVVTDIQPEAPSALARRGYPTQKPFPLMERLIKCCSAENSIVLDAFCGCGTTLIAAQRTKRRWVGIDISPTACREMVKRLREECGIKEGTDFFVRDLPKTVVELRQYPPYEFQNWAINALGGVSSKTKVRDGGIDGKLYPVEDIRKEKREGIDLFGEIDRYIPIQVKRTEQVGRPDIENFEVAMKRDGRKRGIFVGFDFSRDADKEIRRVAREEGLEIEPIKVSEILEKQLNGWLK
jgi:site-specific DNA-methyltransferase (adenine-specific)